MKKATHAVSGIILIAVIGIATAIGLGLKPHDIAFFTPITSNNAESPLTAEQLKSISSWLQQHSEGWEIVTYTPSGPEKSITLKTPDGKSLGIMIFAPSTEGPTQNVILDRGADEGMVVQAFPLKDVEALTNILGK